MRAPTAPAPGTSKARSSRPVFPRATGAVARSAVRSTARPSVGPGQNKKCRFGTAANEACLDPLLWRRRGAVRNPARLGRFGKARKTLAFLACRWKPLKTGFCQRPVDLRSLLMPDFVGFCSGAQGQNRTADTRIFNPLLYRLSYLGRRQWRKGGFLEEAPAPVQPCLTADPDDREAPNFRSFHHRPAWPPSLCPARCRGSHSCP